jgi:hypothetical protein
VSTIAEDRAPSLFGFGIRSEVPLKFLREGGGVGLLEVIVTRGPAKRPAHPPLGEWPLHGASVPATAALYEIPGGYEYWTTDAGRFAVHLDRGVIEIPADGDEILREQRLNGMPMLLAFAHRGDISLHAAAVEVDGGAIILAAPSMFGKTTLALAFHERGYRLLTEDLVCCRPGTTELIPGPALARMRPDVYAGAPPKGMEAVAIKSDRVFLAPPVGQRGSTAPLPVRGICLLREGESLRAEPAQPLEVVKDIWHLGFRMPTAEGRSESFRQVTRLATAVPVWNVHRPMKLELLGDTVELIASLSRG